MATHCYYDTTFLSKFQRAFCTNFCEFVADFNGRKLLSIKEKICSLRNGFSFAIISIHASNEGSDQLSELIYALVVALSIHAPNEGSDISNQKRFFVKNYFNPRSQ